MQLLLIVILKFLNKIHEACLFSYLVELNWVYFYIMKSIQTLKLNFKSVEYQAIGYMFVLNERTMNICVYQPGNVYESIKIKYTKKKHIYQA